MTAIHTVKRNFFTPVLLLTLIAGCSLPPTHRNEINMPTPPVADVRPFEITSANGTRIDNYYWLRDDKRENADMLAYLAAENAYTEKVLARLQPLQNRLYEEIIGRIQKDDSTVPYRFNGYYYYTRYEADGEYPIHARRKGSPQGAEEILLDGNELAKGHDFFSIGNLAVSPDNRLLAWAEDTTGRRQYTIRFKDLASGDMLPDAIAGNQSSLAWADDNQTLFYIEKDPVTLLGVRVKRHRLGTDPVGDSVVYEEPDDSYYMSLSRSGDERYIVLHLGSSVADEIRFLPVTAPNDEFSVLYPRERHHEYDADHIDDRWMIRTNWQAENFRLMEAADGRTGDREQWHELVAHDASVYIGAFDIFDSFLVLAERRDGLRTLEVLDRQGHPLFPVAADDPAYVMDIDTNMEADTDWLRYSYSSLTTPETIYEINMRTRERRMLKRQPVPGGFDPENYRSERVWVTARDGARIPVSMLYRKDYVRDGSAPLYLYAYGSYGLSTDPAFEDEILSLVDRGFVYAIAHVRGGQELGRAWYDAGKLLHKINTFTDFIDVTIFLGSHGYADAKKIAASGGSAGGLLIGAVTNRRPDLYNTIVADVPFVDVVTTMLDASIPLTTNEYDEWGNPANRKYYEYMLRYSPYDNVRAQNYPAMLVTTGLWDSQVQYYEPAKWVAKLRALKTDDNPLILHINMDAGHGGQSGRFRRNRELAMEYAFIIDRLGVTD